MWLRLVEQLAALRDPAALPGWLATTTQRGCLRVLRGAQRRQAYEWQLPTDIADGGKSTAVDQGVLAAERNAVLRDAFAWLPERCRRLLALLIQDPPVAYAEISSALAVPVGSIGPSRARCLGILRRYPPLAALIGAPAAPQPRSAT